MKNERLVVAGLMLGVVTFITASTTFAPLLIGLPWWIYLGGAGISAALVKVGS